MVWLVAVVRILTPSYEALKQRRSDKSWPTAVKKTPKESKKEPKVGQDKADTATKEKSPYS